MESSRCLKKTTEATFIHHSSYVSREGVSTQVRNQHIKGSTFFLNNDKKVATYILYEYSLVTHKIPI